jgi:hypothetical protein
VAERPCDAYIVIDPRLPAGRARVDTEVRGVTRRLYCESGAYGHQGTHYGSRSEIVYRQLVKRWRDERR